MSDWLSDYEAKESEIADKHMIDSPRYEPGTKDWVSFRMPDLTSPVGYCPWGNLWSVAPMYGTTVVTMPPALKSVNSSRLGIAEEEWDKLLVLARARRIRFVLTGRVTSYREHEYLHPLIKEFSPPILPTYAGYAGASPAYAAWTDEFNTVARVRMLAYIHEMYSSLRDMQLALENMARHYVLLKTLGYEELAEQYLALCMDDPNKARIFYSIYGPILTIPASNVMSRSHQAIHVLDKERLTSRLAELAATSSPEVNAASLKQVLPYDVGKFLMRKLAYGASGYEGCMRLIDIYKAADIQKIFIALQKGCSTMDPSQILSSQNQLSEVLDGMWKDSDSIASKSKKIGYGISLGITAVGLAATLPLGGVGAIAGLGLGSIAGLGFTGIELATKSKLTRSLTALLCPSSLLAIHDFKTKYPLGKDLPEGNKS